MGCQKETARRVVSRAGMEGLKKHPHYSMRKSSNDALPLYSGFSEGDVDGPRR